jgi:hypothetical protein
MSRSAPGATVGGCVQEGGRAVRRYLRYGAHHGTSDRDMHVGLTGGLDELGLTELVEMVTLGEKTGLLTLRDDAGAEAGWLAFRDGRLVGGAGGALTAEKAFYGLLALKTGTFSFDPQAQLDEETCDLATESLLMEGMRRIDETRQLRRELPASAVVRLLGGPAVSSGETRVLGYLGPGARKVGDIVDGVLVGGELDEYDTLTAISRLAARDVVRIERPPEGAAGAGGLPQPELER